MKTILQELRRRLGYTDASEMAADRPAGSATSNTSKPASERLAELLTEHRRLRDRLKKAQEELHEFLSEDPAARRPESPVDRASRLHRGNYLQERVHRISADLLSFQRSTLSVTAELRMHIDESDAAAHNANLESLAAAERPFTMESLTDELLAAQNRADIELGEVKRDIDAVKFGADDERAQLEELLSKSRLPVPVLPVRDTFIPERKTVKLQIGRPRSVAAIGGVSTGTVIVIVSQSDPAVDDAGPSNLRDSGLLASISEIIHRDDGSLIVRATTMLPVSIAKIVEDGPKLFAHLSPG